MTRIRASSSAFPAQLQLNPTHQYRTLPSQQPATAGLAPSIPRSSSFSGTFGSAGFQSAPLHAPGDFHLPRTPGDAPPRDYGSARDYSIAQMNAPGGHTVEFMGFDLGAAPRENGYQGGASLHEQRQQHQQEQQPQQHRDSSGY